LYRNQQILNFESFEAEKIYESKRFKERKKNTHSGGSSKEK